MRADHRGLGAAARPGARAGVRRAGDAAAHGVFPGALYDGDGTLLAGDGPEMRSLLMTCRTKP